MPRHRKPRLAAYAERENRAQLAALGHHVRASRRRRHLTQARFGRLVGLAQTTISMLERGEGGTLSLDTWQRVGRALDRPFVVSLGRDALEEPIDAGHLGIQELVLRLGRAGGAETTFELATKPHDPARSTDVGLSYRQARRLVLIECVNTFGDVGASVRSSDRKRAEAEQLALALGGERPYAVHLCWVVRATKRNRALVARYPELFASRFPGSSVGWVRALTTGSSPPAEPGLVWCDAHATRLFAPRRGRPPGVPLTLRPT
jgi:transcriptional regulator with XRE-family HTH domain